MTVAGWCFEPFLCVHPTWGVDPIYRYESPRDIWPIFLGAVNPPARMVEGLQERAKLGDSADHFSHLGQYPCRGFGGEPCYPSSLQQLGYLAGQVVGKPTTHKNM